MPTQKEKRQLKRKLGFIPEEMILVFSGRLDPGKGIFFLLDGFKKVVQRYKNIRLVLIGECPDISYMNQYFKRCKNIWSKVTFTGFLEYESVLEFYQISDIGILPSLYDQCPYSLLEMMSYRIPLILSDIDGLNEVLNENQCIFLTTKIDENGEKVINIEDLSKAILYLIKNKTKRSEITREYLNLITTKYSAQRMSKEFLLTLKHFYSFE